MKRKALRDILSITILGIIAYSCSHEEPLKIESNDLIPIELSTRGDYFVDQGNSFAYKLLQKVEQEEDSDFTLSPLSLNLAFGMLIEGAEQGQILDSVCKVLGFEEGGRTDIRDYCSTMMKRLPEMDKLSSISMSNLVVTNNDLGNTDQSFQAAVHNYYYNSYVKGLPFSYKKGVLDYVNNWGYENSNKKIRETIKESDFDNLSTAILVNTLYFKGQWANYFKRSKTTEENFTTERKDVKKVKMMKQEGYFAIGSFNNVNVLRMLYGNGAFVFDVLLPNDGISGVREVINSMILCRGEYERFLSSRKVDVWLPKFESSGRIQLEKILKEMGMGAAFEKAWLKLLDNNITESNINNVFQVSSIKIDEAGTEAAAVSVITTALGAANPGINEPQTCIFHADRPFVYTIRESSTGAVLFAGVYRGEK